MNRLRAIRKWINTAWNTWMRRRACKHEKTYGELVEMGMRKVIRCAECDKHLFTV